MQELLQGLFSAITAAWRFRSYAVAAACGVGVVGLVIVTLLPNVYEASARIYVDGSSVLRPLLNDQIVTSNIGTQLAYVRQALLGREHLERVATENGLDATVRTLDARERMLEGLLRELVIEAVPANREDPSNRSSIFTIKYRHTNTDVAVGV